jgi:hypothetical protein
VQIEQAVFTSAKTDRAQGYQLLSRSPHLSEADAREISLWAPSHGALLEPGEAATSANCFQLSSGAYCVSRTSQAGAEYSGRGELIYTQFLIVPPDVLARFANNPFAILRAASAIGDLCVRDNSPETLPPLQLAGRAPVVDLSLVAQLAREPGPTAMADLVEQALANERLAICSETPVEQLVAGLLNLLPVECRTAFSFSTGLKFSTLRNVRLCALPADESEWRSIARHGVATLKLEHSSPTVEGRSGWAGWIEEVLRSGKLSVLAAELEQPRPGLTCAGLDSLGNRLLASLHADHPSRPTYHVNTTSTPRITPPAAQQRADLAHPQHMSGMALEEPERARDLDQLAERLARQPGPILEMLEKIDDLVFAAIAGDTGALAELEVLWPLTASELEPELVEQTREQYLRCALSLCGDSAEGIRARPERALAAVDVLCVLFEE